MSAQEEAIRLVNKYFLEVENTDWEEAKQCALITVDEIIDNTEHWYHTLHSLDIQDYYRDVKQEIQKL